MKVHKTAALCQTGHSASDRIFYRPTHRIVFGKPCCKQFRITSRQQKSICVFRHFRIMERRKECDLCPQFFQKLQVVFIQKAECLIFCHCDLWSLSAYLLNVRICKKLFQGFRHIVLHLFRTFRHLQNAFNIQRFLQNIRQTLHLLS